MSHRKSPVRRSLPLITVAGCLVMFYATATVSPVFTDFMRAIGAREVHFGLLGGIPMIMISAQFLGAFIVNSLRSRKTMFMTLAISGRLLYLPIAFLPILFPRLDAELMLNTLIVMVAVSAGLSNMIGPPWSSWMADLIPHAVLGRYWGVRQKYMHATGTFSYLVIVALTYFSGWPATRIFPVIISIGVAAAIVDVLLFFGVHEPPNTMVRGRNVFETIMAPLKNRDYRRFVVFSCAWSAAAMFAAAFLQIYVLKVLGLPMWQTALIWCFLGIGVALSSGLWGRLADEYGSRPIFMFCMAVKPLILVVFLLITRETALWLLSLAFLIDSMWNSAMMVASNGYMLKAAPVENRSMYIAAISGLAGICGGIGAMAGGVFLETFSDFSLSFMGRMWNNYQLLFLVDIFFRMGCMGLAFRIREPRSSSSATLVHALWQVRPMRVILFPIGLYRLLTGRPWKEESTGQDEVI